MRCECRQDARNEELQKICVCLRQPKSEDDDDDDDDDDDVDKEVVGWGGSKNNINGETSCSNTSNTWLPNRDPLHLFSHFFLSFSSSFFSSSFSHLAFSGRSSFRAVGIKKRDKNRTQIPGVNG